MPYYIEFSKLSSGLSRLLHCEEDDLVFYWDLYDQDSLDDFEDVSIYDYSMELNMVVAKNYGKITGYHEECIYNHVYSSVDAILEKKIEEFTGGTFRKGLSSFIFAKTSEWETLSEKRTICPDGVGFECRIGKVSGLVCIHNLSVPTRPGSEPQENLELSLPTSHQTQILEKLDQIAGKLDFVTDQLRQR